MAKEGDKTITFSIGDDKEEEMKRLLDEVGVDMVTTEYYFE